MVLLRKYQQRVKRSSVDPFRLPGQPSSNPDTAEALMLKSPTLDAYCPSASSPPELSQVLDKKEQHLRVTVGKDTQTPLGP